MVPPAMPRGSAEALGQAMGDDAWRTAVAARGHSRFEEQYSAESVYPRVEQIWLDALDDRDASNLQRFALRSS